MSKELSGVEIVGITGTFYPDTADVRFELALETIEGWTQENLPVIVSDGSPFNEKGRDIVGDALRSRGAYVERAVVPGIASQRQEAIKLAIGMGADKFLTHEPEKVRMPFHASVVVGELVTGSSVVVVGRDQEAIDSMPSVQRRTEVLAGWILNRGLLIPEDSLAGPRGYDIVGVQHLLNYPSEEKGMNNWIYMYQNILEAKRAGQKTSGVKVPIVYPETMVKQEQGNIDFDRKRYMQFVLQLDYLLRRPEVLADMKPITEYVLAKINGLSEDPQESDYLEMLALVETVAEEFDYQKPAI